MSRPSKEDLEFQKKLERLEKGEASVSDLYPETIEEKQNPLLWIVILLVIAVCLIFFVS